MPRPESAIAANPGSDKSLRSFPSYTSDFVLNPTTDMNSHPTSNPAGKKAADYFRGLDPGELLARGLESLPTPAAGAEPLTVAEMQKLLPQYRVECLLGAGGMGAVYQALHPALDRRVAIKILPPEIAVDEQFVGRFQREARTLAKLQHPGIIGIHDFGQTPDGHLYFAMEYVDGADLRRILDGPGLQPDQALILASEICEALHFAHSKGVVHRDIKPANILVTQDGHAKLADFGLSRPADEEATQYTSTSVIVGTSDYMAPEQRDGRADHRADIFSLGITLYEMLTGQRPTGAFELPSAKAPVDVRLDQVVIKALQEEPSHRYQHASEMRTDLEHIRTTVAPPVVRPGGGWRALLLAAASLAAMSALGAVWHYYGEAHPGAAAKSTPVTVNAETHVAPRIAPPVDLRATQPSPTSHLVEPTAIRAGYEKVEAASVEAAETPRRGAPAPLAAQALPTPAETDTPLRPPVAATKPPDPKPPGTAPGGGQLEAFAKSLPQAAEWATAPLNVTTPANLWEVYDSMEAGLKSESAQTPQASPAAYALALRICNVLHNSLRERRQMLDRNARLAHGRLTDAWLNQWSTRADVIQAAIGDLYGQLRTAVIQSPPPAWPAPDALAVNFPPLPEPAHAPSQPYFNADNPNPLDRGAYNQHSSWPWHWSWYRYGYGWW